MSKIVILVGSVRKDGNTDLLARAFADGARKKNDVEIVSVADYKVNPCIGCNTREDEYLKMVSPIPFLFVQFAIKSGVYFVLGYVINL